MSDDRLSDSSKNATELDPWDVPGAPVIPSAWSTPEFVGKADAIFGRYPRRINALLPILQFAAACHPLTTDTLPHVARLCWTTTEQALRVAQAYGLLRAGEDVPTVTFCVNIHCQRNGSEELRAACRTILQGQPVVLREYVCFGYCDEGPCVEVNDRLIVKATASKIVTELSDKND